MTAERLQGLLPHGHLILAGPTPGAANACVAIFEASDEQATCQIMVEEPVISSGYPRDESRPFRGSLLHGRD